MCRPWGIRLKRERNEVCINPKEISPWVTLSAGRMRGVACIPLGLMQTSLRSRLSRVPHGRHIKEERKEIRIGHFSLDGSIHQTGDAAFTPATPHDLRHSRANNDSHNSHNTQHTRVKQNTLCFTQKDTQPSQTCLEGTSHHIRPQNRCG